VKVEVEDEDGREVHHSSSMSSPVHVGNGASVEAVIVKVE
jgi:hypothetical protein